MKFKVLFIAFIFCFVLFFSSQVFCEDGYNGKVMTVNGPIDSSLLGITLPHEHLLLYLMQLNSNHEIIDTPIQLNDKELAATELSLFKNHSLNGLEVLKEYTGRTLVELSNRGLRWELAPQSDIPDFLKQMKYPEALKWVSDESKANIVMGTSYYKQNVHPLNMDAMSIEEIEELIINDILYGVDGTGIKAGIIGEIGISTLTNNEQKVLVASALAQLKTGAPVNVHFDFIYDDDYNQVRWDVLRILKELGVDPSRVIFSHLYSNANSDTLYEDLLKQNIYVEFDFFGNSIEDGSSVKNLIDKGYINKLLISQDVSTSNHLKANGGGGYTYILDQGRKEIQFQGKREFSEITPENLKTMMVDNTKDVLQFKISKKPGFASLISNWDGNLNANDSVSSNNGAENNGISYASGINSPCFNFDGSNDYINIPNSNRITSSNPFSISAWFKADASQSGQYTTIIDQSHEKAEIAPGKIAVNKGWVIQIEPDGNLQFGVGTGTNWNVVHTGVDVRDGEWHHVAGVYTGDQLKIYLDGSMKENIVMKVIPINSNGDLNIGCSGGWSRFLKGSVDEVKLFNGSLTDSEILNMYNSKESQGRFF